LIFKVFRRAEQPSVGKLYRALSTFAIRGDALSTSSLFPDDFQKEAQASVRQMVVYKAPTNDFFASVAWSWFGVISEGLLRRHGCALYYNAFLEGNHFGVDGLTNLVLAASERYGRPQPFPHQYALDALAAVARVGFAGPPLVKNKFDRALFGASGPLGVWQHLLRQLRKVPEAAAGGFFIFLLVEAINRGGGISRTRYERSTKEHQRLSSELKGREKIGVLPANSGDGVWISL
jgi:hypothetical protein